MSSTGAAIEKRPIRAVVMGVSAGGMQALPEVLAPLREDLSAPIVVVQHQDPHGTDGFLSEYLNGRTALTVTEASERTALRPGYVYMAPSNYHVLIESDETLSLSVDEKVNHARPSIDVLFMSAARVFGPSLAGVILTGASSDGALGLKAIKAAGGLTIAQDPESAQASIMPAAAIQACKVDHVLPLGDIPRLLNRLL